MKYKIENLDDITDSREILQSSPKGFSKIMTYIILALLASVIVWSLIAHKEVSIRASGVVRPGSDVNKVSSSLAGNISEINVKDGDKVNEGDTLIVINGSQYELQKNVLQKSLDDKNKNLELTKRLKQSILDGENKFDADNEDEKEYSKKYELFQENLNSSGSQNSLYEEQKKQINNEISNLQLLQKGIEEGKNYFKEGDPLYYQYNDYVLSAKSYDDQIKLCEDNIKSGAAAGTDLKSLNDNLQNYKSQKDKLKNTAIMNVSKQIEEDKNKLTQLQISGTSGTYKEQYISNLDSSITTLQSTMDEINVNLETINAQLDAVSIKATSDGIVNMLSDVSVGDFIQGGAEIASIVPEDEGSFQIDVYINNESFGNIKDGQDVMVELASLSAHEYGYIKSNLENISADAKSSQNASYYTATCPIEETFLTNKKGENADIKNGMIAEVRIVSRRVTYFRYFLEKIDILD